MVHDGLPRTARVSQQTEDKWVFVFMVKRDETSLESWTNYEYNNT